MEYLIAKWLHICNASLLVGVGLGSAMYLLLAYRSGDARLFHQVAGFVVKADWWITTPTIIVQPLSGWWLMTLSGYDWHTPWLWRALWAFAIAGACWLPVVWIQIQLHRLSASGEISIQVTRLFCIWIGSGLVAFPLMFWIYWLMLVKP